ncbi:MAG: PAS domain S-box protein [Methanocella sp.]
MPGEIDLKWLYRYKVPALLLLVIACIIAAIYREDIGVADAGYIHVFYLPAIIAALWFGRKALLPAVALALAEMIMNYLNIGTITPVLFADGALLVAVAITVCLLSEHMSRLNTRLADSDRQLHSSEAGYQVIFNAASDGIMLYDPATDRLVDANEAWVKMTGYSVEESKTMRLSQLSTEEEGYRNEDLIRQISNVSRDSGQLFRWKIRRRDGSKASIEINLKNVTIADRNLLLAVIRDIGERICAEEALQESEAKFRVLTETTASAIVILQDNKVKYANPAVEKIVGYTCEELFAMNAIEAASVIDPASFLMLNLARFRRKGSDINLRYEIRLRARNGEKKWVDVTTGMIDYGGRPAFLATGFEITERKLAEKRLRASLHEKDVLLKEVHHRVKNNLQVVTSMLSLQSMKITDPAVLDMFKESQDRVRSMALIHEKLYKSDDLSRISFGEYVRNLTTYLVQSYGVNPETIRLDIDSGDILLSIDRAIPCGLIVNELVSNALKYAFPGGRTGNITVSMHREGGEYTLAVGDNGIGLPPHVDYRNTSSLGLQLVNLLVNQLDGDLALSGDNGTVFSIRFYDN